MLPAFMCCLLALGEGRRGAGISLVRLRVSRPSCARSSRPGFTAQVTSGWRSNELELVSWDIGRLHWARHASSSPMATPQAPRHQGTNSSSLLRQALGRFCGEAFFARRASIWVDIPLGDPRKLWIRDSPPPKQVRNTAAPVIHRPPTPTRWSGAHLGETVDTNSRVPLLFDAHPHQPVRMYAPLRRVATHLLLVFLVEGVPKRTSAQICWWLSSPCGLGACLIGAWVWLGPLLHQAFLACGNPFRRILRGPGCAKPDCGNSWILRTSGVSYVWGTWGYVGGT